MRVAIVYLLILSGLVCSQEAPVVSVPSVVSQEEAAARQLRIYREALLQGSTDVIRIDAAVGLLLQNDTASREILVSALKSDDNPAARLSVCRALIKSRAVAQTMTARQDFLDPLLAILGGKVPQQAKTAAEALLIFDYPAIEPSIRQMLEDKTLDRQIRIQAIDALQLRPEPQALRILIGLLDDTDPEIARAAEKSLQESFGIPVGTSRAVWADIRLELQQKSPSDIRRERLLRQETKLREVQAERDRWQKLFLGAVDRQFETSDEANRLKMIQDSMGSDLPALRLWGLDKVAKNAPAAERLRTALLNLLADPSRDVRLQTARVLTTMSALDPAEKLLERFKVEKDTELALAMFEALGEACFFAYSPGSGIELPDDIKMQTLEIATNYLQSDEPDSAKKGAEVVRKILELNNLPEETAKGYLGKLFERYHRSKDQPLALRADLLSVIAHLCGQGTLRSIASSMYEPLFMEVLEETDKAALRLPAARGLVFVDKMKAMQTFRLMQLNEDESVAVQQVVIELAGQVGQAEDLDWLVEDLLSEVHGEQVWLAVKSICQRQKASFLIDWVLALESTPSVTGDQIREILEIAELKAEGQNDSETLDGVRQRILTLLCQKRSWEQANVYMVRIPAETATEETMINMMTVFLYINQPDRAIGLVQPKLKTADLDRQSAWGEALMAYFEDDTVNPEIRKVVLEKIGSIPVKNRPLWASFVQEAQQAVNGSQEVEAASKADRNGLLLQES
jgi:HEAT repeat protein